MIPLYCKTLDKGSEPLNLSSMSLMIGAISKAKNLSEVSDIITEFNKYQTYETIHIGICKLDDMPVKDIIHSRPISGLGVSINDFDDDIKWAIYKEAEYLLRPFNLLEHHFKVVKAHKLNTLYKITKKLGLKQVMVIPLLVKNTIIVAVINFPNADFKDQSDEILPQFYQLSLALFDRFPKLLTWSKAHKLTLREAEILSLSAKGLTEADIAEKCGISINTVRSHVENSKTKLQARNKLHAVMIAAQTYEIPSFS